MVRRPSHNIALSISCAHSQIKEFYSQSQSLVTSLLDYCNALYIRLSLKSIWKLHLVQNAAAQTVTCVPHRTPATPLLHELHWLPVFFQVQFKLLVLTFKSLHGMGLCHFRTLSPQLHFSVPLCSKKDMLWALSLSYIWRALSGRLSRLRHSPGRISFQKSGWHQVSRSQRTGKLVRWLHY